MLLPEPTYKGPENIIYFRATGLDEEISRDHRVAWIITFYAAWSPSCVNFSPIFSKLSAAYSLPNLKFGKRNSNNRHESYETHLDSFNTKLPFNFLENDLHFAGKIDVGRYPDVAQKYHISTTSLTRQLPTVILFQEGKEAGRVPDIISGKVQKFMFREEDLVNVFDLNNLYAECKKVGIRPHKFRVHKHLFVQYSVLSFSQ